MQLAVLCCAVLPDVDADVLCHILLLDQIFWIADAKFNPQV